MIVQTQHLKGKIQTPARDVIHHKGLGGRNDDAGGTSTST